MTRPILLLLLCCAAQPASSISVALEQASAARAPAEQAPAEQAPKEELTEVQRALEVQALQRELDELDAKHAKGESFAAKMANKVKKASGAEGDIATEGESEVKEDEEKLEAEMQKLKFHQRRRKIEAELEAKQRGLREASEAQRARAQAAAEAARAAKALQQAKVQAAEQASEQAINKGRLRELEIEVEAQQRELDELDAKHAKGEAQMGKKASDLSDAGDDWGQSKVKEAEQELEVEMQRLKFTQRRRMIEAELEAKQRELREATEAQRAGAHAAAEATRAAKALQQAKVQAAEQASEQARAAEAAQAKKHEIKELAKKPGCYVRILSGCPNKPMRTEKWRKDTSAAKQGVDKEGCQERKGLWDAYCGSEDAEMIFVEGGVN